MSAGGHVNWFSLNAADRIKQPAVDVISQAVSDILKGKVYQLFQQHIQVKHLQVHHYCQPRQNMSMQGREQFKIKNNLTLRPVIKELKELFYYAQKKIKIRMYTYI